MKMNRRGVTLLELVIVFAIIAIGALLLVPNMSPWIQNYRLRTAARDIVSTLRTAQMKAVSTNMSYQVLFDPNERTYVLRRNTGGLWVDEGVAQTLPSGVRYDPVPINNPIIFNPNSSSNGGTVGLKNQKEMPRTITVSPSTGRITIQ